MISGKEIMVLELARGLRQRAQAVDVVTSAWGSVEFRERCEQLGARVHVMRLGFISATLSWPALRMTAHQFVYWLGLLLSYSRFLTKVQPAKVIHTNWHHLLLLAPFLKPRRDVFWVHEVIPNKPQYRRFFNWLERRLHCFVAVSHAVAASLRKIDIQEKKIRVIYNGISDPAGGVFEKPGGDKVIIGIIGQIGERKGHDDLVEAFAMIASSLPKAELHIFGKGRPDYQEKLREKAATLGVSDQIRWHGFVTDRAVIYRGMDICVVPSRGAEPLPTVAIEAAFFGIPAIATRQGGLPEIIEHGRTGFLVESARPSELASHLETLLTDETMRREMGDNARREAIEKFGQKRFIEDFVHVIEEK
jgi:glycosyltransferase involved in cell wall biosynthesis